MPRLALQRALSYVNALESNSLDDTGVAIGPSVDEAEQHNKAGFNVTVSEVPDRILPCKTCCSRQLRQWSSDISTFVCLHRALQGQASGSPHLGQHQMCMRLAWCKASETKISTHFCFGFRFRREENMSSFTRGDAVSERLARSSRTTKADKV